MCLLWALDVGSKALLVLFYGGGEKQIPTDHRSDFCSTREDH